MVDFLEVPTSSGHPSSPSSSSLLSSFEVLLRRLAEPDAGVEDDVPGFYAALDCAQPGSSQRLHHVRHQVRVVGIAAVVHQHDRHGGTRDDLQHPLVGAERPLVVDHGRARGDGRLGDSGLGGVHADWNVDLSRDGLHGGHNPRQLLADSDGTGAGVYGRGARRLPADVEYIGAPLPEERSRPDDGVDIRTQTVAREGVGGDVDHPHDVGPVAPDEGPSAYGCAASFGPGKVDHARVLRGLPQAPPS